MPSTHLVRQRERAWLKSAYCNSVPVVLRPVGRVFLVQQAKQRVELRIRLPAITL